MASVLRGSFAPEAVASAWFSPESSSGGLGVWDPDLIATITTTMVAGAGTYVLTGSDATLTTVDVGTEGVGQGLVHALTRSSLIIPLIDP